MRIFAFQIAANYFRPSLSKHSRQHYTASTLKQIIYAKHRRPGLPTAAAAVMVYCFRTQTNAVVVVRAVWNSAVNVSMCLVLHLFFLYIFPLHKT